MSCYAVPSFLGGEEGEFLGLERILLSFEKFPMLRSESEIGSFHPSTKNPSPLASLLCGLMGEGRIGNFLRTVGADSLLLGEEGYKGRGRVVG